VIDFISQYWHSYLIGLLVATYVSIAAMAISVVIGTLGALGRRSQNRILRFLADAYVAVFRAVPPLLALYIVYFGLPSWAAQVGLPGVAEFFAPLDNRIISAIIALALVSAAYSAEIIRAGLASVPPEQLEAARSIGMSYRLAFRRVIAPQAARIAFPPLGNEYIGVLKSTSLASVIGVVELMRAAQVAAGATFENLLAYSFAGVYYIIFVIALQTILNRVEDRFPGV
jgi:His/Glu/Gln/Arg/opine family amino acid ABC transporter permease subunit